MAIMELTNGETVTVPAAIATNLQATYLDSYVCIVLFICSVFYGIWQACM